MSSRWRRQQQTVGYITQGQVQHCEPCVILSRVFRPFTWIFYVYLSYTYLIFYIAPWSSAYESSLVLIWSFGFISIPHSTFSVFIFVGRHQTPVGYSVKVNRAGFYSSPFFLFYVNHLCVVIDDNECIGPNIWAYRRISFPDVTWLKWAEEWTKPPPLTT